MRKRVLTCLLFAFALSSALLLTLAACGGPAPAAPSGEPIGGTVPPSGSQSPPPSDAPSQSQPSPPVVTTPPIPGVPSPAGSQAPAPEAEDAAVASPEPAAQPSVEAPQPQAPTMERAYRAALESIYYDHLYPNGDPVPVAEFTQMKNNDFAVCDVNGDGREELLYQNDDSYTAGMQTAVFHFDPDSGRLYVELIGYCGMDFYDNGVVVIMSAHNHGLAPMGDFWPYAIYQYDPGSGGYLMAAAVDAWDGETFPQDYDGAPFPDDIDADGDRMVYTITAPGSEVTVTAVDGPEYQAWLDTYLAGAAELDIPWKNMTEENIRAVAP